jgi:hypothetical protein
MRYAHVRAVWRPPHGLAMERQLPRGRTDSRSEYISETFSALAKLLDCDEYENMLSQWRLGLREIWLEDGFVMTCYTPPPGV